jgi:nucleoside-diphosphate-sugar epimerase
MGGGLQWRPLVHLSDVANAFIKVIQSDSQAVNQEIFNIGLDNFQIKNLAYLVREELPLPIEIDIAPDDADKRDYNVLFEKAEKKIGFKAQVNVNQGIKEIYSALKYGKVDVGPKTITVQWYRNILDSKKLLDEVMYNNRVI